MCYTQGETLLLRSLSSFDRDLYAPPQVEAVYIGLAERAFELTPVVEGLMSDRLEAAICNVESQEGFLITAMAFPLIMKSSFG